MAISSIAGSLISQSFGTQSAPQTVGDPVAKAFKQADARVEQQLSSTKVKLSAYGQIKGAFAEAQSAGQALANIKKTATANDVKKAAANFVDAFNKANKTVAGAVRGESGALSGDARARLAGVDLGRSLAAGGTLGDLGKIGITQGKDGSLALDAKALDTSLQGNPEQVRGVLVNAGRQVEKTATRELGDNGNVGASVNALGNRAHDLDTQRSTQQEQAAAAQRLAKQRKAQTNNNVVAGSLAAYQRTFTG